MPTTVNMARPMAQASRKRALKCFRCLFCPLLSSSRRSESDAPPEDETKVECAHMNQQTLEDVWGVPQVRPAHRARLGMQNRVPEWSPISILCNYSRPFASIRG